MAGRGPPQEQRVPRPAVCQCGVLQGSWLEIDLKGRVTGWGWGLCHPLVHSPRGGNSQDWPRPKPGSVSVSSVAMSSGVLVFSQGGIQGCGRDQWK